MFVLRALAAPTFAAIVAFAAPALAAQGDCSQPVSTGSAPAASDCLYILKVAVGSLTCSPACICAPKGTLPTSSSDALLCLRKSVGQQVQLNCPCTSLPTGDNFNDNDSDPEKWGDDIFIAGNADLTETNQVLQFTALTASELDYTSQPWIGSVMPYNADWEVQIDVKNTTSPVNDDQVTSLGISVFDERNQANEFYGELYGSHLDGPPTRHGFFGEMLDDGESAGSVDSGGIDNLTTGAVRIAFDAADKVLTLYFDVNPANGYAWEELGSFSVDGSGGADGNADWDMTNGTRFTLEVYGYAENTLVPAGTLTGDNFEVTGGVEP